jgi:MSHA biogenesis protein MshQ
MSGDPGVTVGDHILAAMVIPTDVTTPAQFSAEAFTQAGVTFGAVTEISEPDSTTGNDIGGFVVRSTATAGVGSAAPVMTATAGGTTTNVRGPGVFIRIRDEAAFTQAAFGFYEDGAETGSATINAQDTNIYRDVALGNSSLQLRLRIQEINGLSGAAADDYQLQYSKNAGAYTNVTGASANVLGFNSASLADGGATTNRLTGGSGSFLAGVISEDGLADNHQLTASNYTEYLYSLTLISEDLANGDTLDFRVLRNGAAIASYAVTPRITVGKLVPGSFNVFETATGAGAITGVITTRIAGVPFSLDVVAISGGAQQAGFGSAVIVELRGNNTLGGALDAQNCPTSSTLLQTVTPNPTITGGRSTVNFAAYADAWRDVRVRVRWPVPTPSVSWCSTDRFAIRPNDFANVLVRDLDRTTAGTTRTLDNTADPGAGVVHNAGRPFRIDATARNGAGSPATTTLYVPPTGQPVAILSDCGAPAACVSTPGAVSYAGDYAAASGVITNTGASYNDVGSFNLVLQDQTYTTADSSDPGYPVPATHYILSAPVTVGRFVPDYFSVDAGSTITPRTDIVTCSASTFTYMSERMDLGFTLSARTSGGTVTPSYAGTLGNLGVGTYGNYSFGAVDSVAPTPLTSRLASSGAVSGSWSAGSAAITVPIQLDRAAAPDGPYGSLRFGIAPTDADGVTMRAADLNVDADNSGSAERVQVGPATAVRFGRLRLLNSTGVLALDQLPRIETQYWNGTAFVTNVNDTCTTLSASNLSLSGHTPVAFALDNTHITPATINFSANPGIGNLKVTKPDSAAVAGSAILTVDLSTEAKSYLLGNWGVSTFTANPSARISFGTFGARPRNFIFYRENY